MSMIIVPKPGDSRPRIVDAQHAAALVRSGGAEHLGTVLAHARCAIALGAAERDAAKVRDAAHEALASMLATSRSQADAEHAALPRSPARVRPLVALEPLMFQRERLERGDVLAEVPSEQADDLEVRGLALAPRRWRADLQRLERDLSAHKAFASTLARLDEELAVTRRRLEVQRDAEAAEALREAEDEVEMERARRDDLEAARLAREELATLEESSR